METSVYIRQHGNILEVSNGLNKGLADYPKSLLAPQLSFQKKTFLTSYQRRLAGTASKYSIENVAIYDVDAQGKLYTCIGFLPRIVKVLKEHNLRVFYKEVPIPGKEQKYITAMNQVEVHFKFRPGQKECLNQILHNKCGVINAPTAFGKGTLICMVAMALPNAKIFVTTRRISVLETLRVRLSKYFRNVGQVGGGENKIGDRITVVSGDSLHKLEADPDILLIDEVHEYGADSYAAQLARFKTARMFGFSASPTGRFDGADLRIEGLCGPEIFKMTYQEAVDLGLVAPIRVEWLDVDLSYNPVGSCTDDVYKKRLGIWTNVERNDIIAAKALEYGDSQVLILVDTLEHAVHLSSKLPEYECVYATAEENELRNYRKSGLIGDNFKVLNKKKRQELKEKFERGELRHAIATGVWAVGVDFTNLEVLIRADGGSSEIAGIQVPGRVARINKDINKEFGILVDLKDQFDSGFYNKSRVREKQYSKMGWQQLNGAIKNVTAAKK